MNTYDGSTNGQFSVSPTDTRPSLRCLFTWAFLTQEHTKRVLVQRFSFRNGDSEGTRTPDLQRDRLAFYATELRSHINDKGLGFARCIVVKNTRPAGSTLETAFWFLPSSYVYIISEISIKIKLFLSKFSFKKIEGAEAVLNRLHHARPPLFHLLGEFEPFP